jgi:putative DNA primase/helicase
VTSDAEQRPLPELMRQPVSALTDGELQAVRKAERERADASEAARAEARKLLAEERRRQYADKLTLRCFKDVAPEPIAWLWPGMLPAGRLALLVGDPGVGKSLLAVDLAARVTAGAAWPDGTPSDGPADALILAAEDSPGDYRTRLDAAGADVSRVHVLEAIRTEEGERPVTLADVQAIEAAVAKLQDGGRTVALVILDTVGALLAPGVDDSSNGDVRLMLRPLAKLAADTGAAVVGVHHLRKTAGLALHRTLGSVGWTAAARSVLAVARDRDDRRRRLLLMLKSNYSAEAPDGALAFELDGDGEGRPRLLWAADRVVVNADDILSGIPDDPDERTAVEEAEAWLRAGLAGGPQASADLVKAGGAEGIAIRTLHRARKALRVVVHRSGWPARSTWRLPGPQSCQETAVVPASATRHNMAQQGSDGTTVQANPTDDVFGGLF